MQSFSRLNLLSREALENLSAFCNALCTNQTASFPSLLSQVNEVATFCKKIIPMKMECQRPINPFGEVGCLPSRTRHISNALHSPLRSVVFHGKCKSSWHTLVTIFSTHAAISVMRAIQIVNPIRTSIWSDTVATEFLNSSGLPTQPFSPPPSTSGWSYPPHGDRIKSKTWMAKKNKWWVSSTSDPAEGRQRRSTTQATSVLLPHIWNGICHSKLFLDW